MARLRRPPEEIPTEAQLPENLRLGPIVEVWVAPTAIAAWRRASAVERQSTLLSDPLVTAFRAHAAARQAWLAEHGYSPFARPPGLEGRAPRYARPGELRDAPRPRRRG
jgi:hypothetical protein